MIVPLSRMYVAANVFPSHWCTMSTPLFPKNTSVSSNFRFAELKLDEIHSVELAGGSSRVPAIKRLVEDVFGKPCSTTLNQDEAVARGCALQCAMLSPAVRVRDFAVTDIQPYPIKLNWDASQGEAG